MERGRRIVIVAHCVLNANSRVEGVARYAGVHPLVSELAARGYGIIQLPCPELEAEGLDRPRKTKAEYDTPAYRSRCARLAEETVAQIDSYLDAGHEVAALVGVDGSPSCGVATTSATADGSSAIDAGETHRVPGAGVFVEELKRALSGRDIPFVAVDGHDADLGTARVLGALGLTRG